MDFDHRGADARIGADDLDFVLIIGDSDSAELLDVFDSHPCVAELDFHRCARRFAGQVGHS